MDYYIVNKGDEDGNKFILLCKICLDMQQNAQLSAFGKSAPHTVGLSFTAMPRVTQNTISLSAGLCIFLIF